ncbi:MAG: hypothetical protein LJE63_02235 [Desulfobacteraceae bacterium]|nr:hypothetical protein [Desulfobacteraceae bacterium]
MPTFLSDTGRKWVLPLAVTLSNTYATPAKKLFSFFSSILESNLGGCRFASWAMRLQFLPRPGGETAIFAAHPVRAPV